MALLKWGQDDTENKDDLFNPAPIKAISSVQNGAWQPTANDTLAGTDQPQQSYLLSNEKAQADEAQRQKQAAEAARAAAVAEQADAARRAEATQEAEVVAPIDGNMAAKDEGWKKFYDDSFKKEQDGLDFFGRLMDNGQASKRAEVNARNKYNSELISQAYDENGNTLDQGAADRARSFAAYNQALSENNGKEVQAISNAIGASSENTDEGFWDRIKSTSNAIKNMNIYDGVAGVDDSTRFSGNDIGRFVGGLAQGIFTMPTVGVKELYEAGTGYGTSSETGMEEGLNAGERVGRGVSGALNVVTPFVGGSGKLLESITAKIAKGTATAAEKTLAKQLVSKVLLPAVEQGGIGATQAGAEYFGYGGDLVDENGNLDPAKLLEFAKQTGTAGAMGFGGGALMAGAGAGITRLRNGKPVNPAELGDIETRATTAAEAQVAQNRNAQPDAVDLASLENGVAPAPREPIADGVTAPEAPTKTLDPESQRVYEEAAQSDIPAVAQTADELLTNPVETPAPVDNPVDISNVTPVKAVDNSPAPDVRETTADVADGVPVSATPADMPTVKSEDIRQMQESRVGKNQADEAVINEDLQTANDNTPAYARRTPKTPSAAEFQQKALGGERPDLLPDSTFDADARAVDTGVDAPEIPAYMRKRAGTKIPELKESLATQDKNIADARVNGSEQVTNFKDKQRIAEAYKVSREVGDRMKAYIEKKNKGVTAESHLKDLIIERNKTARELESYQRASESSSIPKEEPVYTPVRDEAPTTPVDAPADVPANVTPVKEDSLPDDMGVDTSKRDGKIDRVISVNDEPKEYIGELADAIGVNFNGDVPIREILDEYGNKGSNKLKDGIERKYDEITKLVAQMNVSQTGNRANLKEGGASAINEVLSKDRSILQSKIKMLHRDIQGDIRALTSTASIGKRISNVWANMKSYRKTNMLAGMPATERNAFQELLGTLNDAINNPKMLFDGFKAEGFGVKAYGRSVKDMAQQWSIPPKSISEIPRYVMGNAYNSLLSFSGIDSLARVRTAAYRRGVAERNLKELGEPVTTENIRKMTGAMGNEAELLANTASGVANFMTGNTQFKKANDAYFDYIENGSSADRQKFMENVQAQSDMVSQMTKQLKTGDSLAGKVFGEVLDFISPFTRVVLAAADTAATGTFNPLAKSTGDYLLQGARGKGTVGGVIKRNITDGSILAGAALLAASGDLAFNNGDEVDKPQGVSIRIPGTDTFIPVRATHIELPLAVVVVAAQITKDINNGDISVGKAGEYLEAINSSLPYVDPMNSANTSIRSLFAAEGSGDDDNLYAAKAYGVNVAKSYTPFANNGITPYAAGKNGESVNAKSTYNENPLAWYGNTIDNSNPLSSTRKNLKDSRDAAGRVRTMDNQGVLVNKNINDANTKVYNDTIDSLVAYARKNNLGGGTQEMFNTYDTGKNNNFKSVQDSITFLDAVDGKPDNTKKLEKNAKLGDLAAQIRDGFYGDTGDDLLMLDGQNLKSDASAPNSTGSKNSKLPLSMQSIKNAIAQTDLGEEAGDKLFAISGQKTELYNALKAKTMSYEQYTAAKGELEKVEIDMLSGSENYKKLVSMMDNLKKEGFFDVDGIGSTRSGQTYLWNSLNALLGSKGATPAANYPDAGKNYTPFGGDGMNATNKPGDRKNKGIEWTPVTARSAAAVKTGKYTPVQIKVKLGNEVKKNKSQNYSDRSF